MLKSQYIFNTFTKIFELAQLLIYLQNDKIKIKIVNLINYLV